MRIEIPGQSGVIGRFGEDAQAMIHMEECAELIQAVSKLRRIRNSDRDDSAATYNLVEEMADVLICLEQMQEIYGISDQELQAMVEKKCLRQEARLRESD